MIPDVILDVKNKIKKVFPCLIFQFSYDLVYSTHLTKNKNKGFRNLKKKSSHQRKERDSNPRYD
ncbi:hypothetical protein A4U62_pgp098 (chloroplast) [Nicotiana sylvestris]|uniref:Uncharacterized protein n=1 Tax=Nicotiana sylvestris TaxID=4096 RepID=Q3C1F8_NICSY|nr:hypothetical protein A4U62_pgp098 [Nicotiana sylvestris]BAE46631.1 hypothetical protein [Nicotiana sylvestris]